MERHTTPTQLLGLRLMPNGQGTTGRDRPPGYSWRRGGRHHEGQGARWTVGLDPEGNEYGLGRPTGSDSAAARGPYRQERSDSGHER